jgi:hypothetical protein
MRVNAMGSSITHDQTLDVNGDNRVPDGGHSDAPGHTEFAYTFDRGRYAPSFQVEEAEASLCRAPTRTPATAPVSMITSLTTTSLVHGSLSSSSLPVTVKIASGGSWPVYPSILGCPRSSVLMMSW